MILGYMDYNNTELRNTRRLCLSIEKKNEYFETISKEQCMSLICYFYLVLGNKAIIYCFIVFGTQGDENENCVRNQSCGLCNKIGN